MTPLQLRYFVEIARCESVSTAASKLHVTQPSLSHHLALLEQEIGAPLVTRHARGVSLTDQGQRLLLKAIEIQAQLDGLREHVTESAGPPKGAVRLCLADSVAAPLAGELFVRIREKYADIDLTIVTAMSAKARQMVLDRRVDMALMPSAGDIHGLRVVPVVQEKLCLFYSRKHWSFGNQENIAPEDACRLPLALPTHEFDIRRFLEREMAVRGLRLAVAFEIDNAEVARSLIRAGTACGIWPSRGWPESQYDPSIGKMDLAAPPMGRVLSIVWYDDRYQTSATTAVREEVFDLLGGGIDKN